MSYSNNSRAASAYREREILNASPGRLVVIVFDHVLANMFRAGALSAPDRLEFRLEALTKSRAGIMELLATLDLEKGGQIATNLKGLYGFVYTELMDEARNPDKARLDKLMTIIKELRDAFATIAGENVALVSAA
jgi:flagellar secretion chaperone FliS